MRICKTTALLVAGLTLGFAAQAAEQPSTAIEGSYAGIRAAIDPATGKLRPLTAAESAKLSAATVGKKPTGAYVGQPRNATEAGKTLRKLPSGAVSVRVPADQMSQLDATIAADGSVVMTEGGNAVQHAQAHPEAMK